MRRWLGWLRWLNMAGPLRRDVTIIVVWIVVVGTLGTLLVAGVL